MNEYYIRFIHILANPSWLVNKKAKSSCLTILVVSAVKLWEYSQQKKSCFLNLRKAGNPETRLIVILEVRVPFLTIEKLRFTQP